MSALSAAVTAGGVTGRRGWRATGGADGAGAAAGAPAGAADGAGALGAGLGATGVAPPPAVPPGGAVTAPAPGQATTSVKVGIVPGGGRPVLMPPPRAA